MSKRVKVTTNVILAVLIVGSRDLETSLCDSVLPLNTAPSSFQFMSKVARCAAIREYTPAEAPAR